MISEKHTRNIIIIGDGYSDYTVLKRLVSVLVEHDNANEISLNNTGIEFCRKITSGNFVQSMALFIQFKTNGYVDALSQPTLFLLIFSTTDQRIDRIERWYSFQGPTQPI